MSSPIVSPNGHDPTALVPSVVSPAKAPRPRISKKRIKMLLDQLAVPFDPLIIQWRIVEVNRVLGRFRGRVIPYADKLAYIDRLTRLLTPAGWSSNLFVHPSIITPTERGRAAPAKIVVTCQLTLHGLGTHSSTGEEWALDENAATSAEAQAFKRACANFGLGAYLYYFFRGFWVDLDSKKQIQTPPQLPAWATPDGWEAGARPSIERVRDVPDFNPSGLDANTIRSIEAMHNDLGPQVYRRILKRYLVWEPKQIRDSETAAQVLADMKAAAPLMLRAAYALERMGKPAFDEIIKSFNLKSVADFGEFGVLERVVAALEAKMNNLDAI
jgi:hypothetical protein